MRNQYIANHSLWPKQAKPPRAKQSALAMGSFGVGVIASILAYNVLTELAPPAPEPTQPSVIAQGPVYATPSAAAPVPMLAANSTSSNLVVAKLPSASAPPPAVSLETDGRGNGAPATFATTPSAPAIKPAEFVKPAAEPAVDTAEVQKPAGEIPVVAAAPEAKPAAPPVRTVQKKRAQPNYASRNRNQPFFPFFGFFGQRG